MLWSFFRRFRTVAKGDYYFRHVCPLLCLSIGLSFRMEQLGSNWTDFYEILYFSIFRKPVGKNFKLRQGLARIVGTLHEQQCALDHISLRSS
jgi:hypothetical protein